MKIKRTHPCQECPFRKKSLPGWLGPWENAGKILEQSQSEVGLPCHMDYDPRLRKGIAPEIAMEQSHVCVGSLQNANCSGKIYRNPLLAKFADMVGKSADVLGLGEFFKHHGRSNE